MPIARIVKLTLKKSHSDDFEEFVKIHFETIRSMPGCLYLQIVRAITQPHIFHTYSIWKEEEYLEMYRQSEFFQEIWQGIKPWFAEKAIAYSNKIIKP